MDNEDTWENPIEDLIEKEADYRRWLRENLWGCPSEEDQEE